MPRLGPTIADLLAQRRRSGLDGLGSTVSRAGALANLAAFGSNPGALQAHVHVPAGLLPGAALVVVLHGCTQTASDYALGAGWRTLADTAGFALLCPEQQRTNNPNLCFNWFSPADNRRDRGEALSIRQMIAAMIDQHALDPRRVFITGLSAGGAMASIMLASYPDVFAGGAIIAGLPHGAADSMGDAFARMRGDGHGLPVEQAERLRAASDHRGPWPAISVWQGMADPVVDPSNADRIVAQWQPVHGVDATAAEVVPIKGGRRRIWRNLAGAPVIEAWQIDTMAHGTPIDAGMDGPDAGGPYLLDIGLSSTAHIAAGWGLAPPPARSRPGGPSVPAPAKSLTAIIEDSLRAAGLLR